MVKATITVSFFEILQSKRGSVLSPVQWGTGSERVKVSVRIQKNDWKFCNLLGKCLAYKIKRFWHVIKFFWFCLTLSVLEKFKSSIFELPVISQTLNINKLRTASAKSLNLHTIRKLIECLLKLLPFSGYCSLKGRLVF